MRNNRLNYGEFNKEINYIKVRREQILKYIILLVTAIIVFPILIRIARRKNIGNWIVIGTLAGLVISIIGLVMQDLFNPLVVLLTMFGLAFVVSVLLDNGGRMKRN